MLQKLADILSADPDNPRWHEMRAQVGPVWLRRYQGMCLRRRLTPALSKLCCRRRLCLDAAPACVCVCVCGAHTQVYVDAKQFTAAVQDFDKALTLIPIGQWA